jgi:hypothetical protein
MTGSVLGPGSPALGCTPHPSADKRPVWTLEDLWAYRSSMAGVEASWPPVRVSDADRDRVLRSLREGVVDGRLSEDTFFERVEAALRARRRADLARLVDDLSARRRRRGLVGRMVSGVSRASWRLGHAWRAPRLPCLWLPGDRGRALTIGRDPGCDLMVDHQSVSRRHALLRPTATGWELSDLGSTNGTRINGWRLGATQALSPGDEVTFGAVTLQVVHSDRG